MLATEDGSGGVRGRITVPLEAALQGRPLGNPVKLYVCGPTPMMRACAQLAGAHGRACDVSLEQVMGCGLGGCYSCVVLALAAADGGAPHHTRILHRGPGLRRPARRLGRGGRTLMDLSVNIGSLTLANPLIAASGCFGYGVEYADVVDLASLGGVAVKGLFLAEREGHHRRASSKRRRAC